jgi:hypothetical protein
MEARVHQQHLLMQQVPRHKRRSNLTSDQRLALTQLRQHPRLVVKPADKNLGPVVMDRIWYQQECLRQLRDPHYYRPVSAEQLPLSKVWAELVRLIQNHPLLTRAEQKSILGPTYSFATTASSLPPALSVERLPSFYLLPKIHKSPVVGRPIVASHSYFLSPAARWLDEQLQPVVRRLSTVIRDSKELIRLLESHPFHPPPSTSAPASANLLSANSTTSSVAMPSIVDHPSAAAHLGHPEAQARRLFLFTGDITSLYTNIPHGDGITAVRNVLYMDRQIPLPKIDLILSVLHLVLHHNYFTFDQQAYHQVHGTAMGSPAAPCYANLFLYYLECRWLAAHRARIMLYKRYLDDVFGVVWATESEALAMLSQFNTFHPSIQMVAQLHHEHVHFLDLTIFKGPRFVSTSCLDLSPYAKPTSRFLFLHFSSYHSRSVKAGLIKAELIRMIRNSSSYEIFDVAKRDLVARLKLRGYPTAFITECLLSVKYSQRAAFLLASDSRESLPKGPTVVLPLLRNPVLTRIPWRSILPPLSEPSVIVSWRMPPSLGQSLVRSRFDFKPQSVMPHDRERQESSNQLGNQ